MERYITKIVTRMTRMTGFSLITPHKQDEIYSGNINREKLSFLSFLSLEGAC